jgi:spermidine synthase
VDATLKEAGLNTWPYHAYVPSFGDWGFILAGKRKDYALPEKITVATRYLDPATMRELFHFPADMPALAMPPNRLNEQSLVRYFDEDWRQVIR